MKKEKLEIFLNNIKCPECGISMSFRSSKFGYFYGCDNFYLTRCTGKVSAHKNGTIKKPFTTYAEKQARLTAQAVFDNLWMNHSFTKQEAFNWLCEQIKCPRAEARISSFTIEQCNLLINKVKELYP